jgi:hypothetical protein
MTVAIRHKFTSMVADAQASGFVKPSNWNDTHAISLAAGSLLGRWQGTPGDASEIAVDVNDLQLDSSGLHLSPTGIQPGFYTNANVIVDAKGRITQIANGTSSGGANAQSEYLLGAADGDLGNARLPVDTSTIAWDMTTDHEFKANWLGLVTDLTPQLGGDLDLNGHVISGLEIGIDVQAHDAQLDDIAGLTPTDGNIIVGDGANWVAESGATARTSLGLGTGDTPQFTAVRAADGSATSAAYGFANDPQLGIFRAGSNILGFGISNAERMRLQGVSGGAQLTILVGGTEGSFALGSITNADVKYGRDGFGIAAIRNGTNAQILRGYRTWANAGTDYERWALQTGSGYMELAAETGGTGTDDLDLRLTPAGTGRVTTAAGVSVGGTLELGHASDTTLSRVSAGVAAIEGNNILTANLIGSTVQSYDADTAAIAALSPSDDDIIQRKGGAWSNRSMAQLIADLAALGTTFQPLDADLTAIAGLSTTVAGRSILTVADPNADRIMAWDDSAGAIVPIALADIAAEASPAAGDYVLAYLADGSLAKVDWDLLPGAGTALSVETLMDLVEPTAASEASDEITLDVDDGNALFFTRTMTAHELILDPVDMPLGSTISLLIDPTQHPTSAPVVAATAKAQTAAGTSHSITLPSGIAAGHLLLVIVSMDGSPTLSVDTGASGNNWNMLGQASNGSNVTGAVFWKFAEGSDVLTITSSASEEGTHISFRITGALQPDDVHGISANGSSTNPDPADLTGLVSQEYLLIASTSHDAQVVSTVAPSGYANLDSQAAATSGGASTSIAYRTATVTNENPGTFTATTEQWVTWTIAIGPSGFYVASFDSGFEAPLPDIETETLLTIQNIGSGRFVAVKAWEAE